MSDLREGMLYKLSQGTYTARWAHDEIVRLENKVDELQAENAEMTLKLHNQCIRMGAVLAENTKLQEDRDKRNLEQKTKENQNESRNKSR